MILSGLVATFGDAAIAANSVASTVGNFQILPGMAINLGATAVIAQCIGAEDTEQAVYYAKKILGYVWAGHLVSVGVIHFATPLILTVYSISPDTALLAREAIWWHGLFIITIWPLASTLPVIFRGAGDARFPMVVGTASMFLFRIEIAFVLGTFFDMGMMSVWWSMFLDWVLKTAIYVPRFCSRKWTKKRVI